jgi:serine/threonine-protein kinase
MRIWDCAVLQDALDQPVAERLVEEAGELELHSLGDFWLLRKLGAGGMGSVWLALSPEEELVAVKLLDPELARERTFVTRFLREGQAALRLRHPNIVRGRAVGEDSGRYFFAMEFVPGSSVRAIVEAAGPISLREAALLVLQVAAGLAYGHERGIVHRDIKPGNILLTREGIAKLADFGLARRLDADLTALTRSGMGMGTPQYMAPEQIRDARSADARSDVYSLGATWYHMVVGRPPFLGATMLEVCQKHLGEELLPPAAANSTVPEEVSKIIERMMAKDPNERCQTAADVTAAVRAAFPEDAARMPLLEAPVAVGPALYEVEVPTSSGVRSRSLFVSELKAGIRAGQIKADTPVRPLHSDAVFRPVRTIPELAGEFSSGPGGDD